LETGAGGGLEGVENAGDRNLIFCSVGDAEKASYAGMMFAKANPNVGPVPLSSYVRKIAMVCEMHAVPRGAAHHLIGFLVALEENKHLAMDFWSLVARMSDADSDASVDSIAGSASDSNRLLAVIVEGVTASSVAEVRDVGPEEKRAVAALASMLAGHDVPREPKQRPRQNLYSKPSEFAAIAAAIAAATAPTAPAPVSAVAASIASAAALAASEAEEEQEEVTVPIVEPASVKTVPAPVLPVAVQPAPIAAVPVPHRDGSESRRLVLEPESAPLSGKKVAHQQTERPLFLAMSGYAEEDSEAARSGMVAGGALLLLLIVGGTVFYARHGGAAGWQRFEGWARAEYGAVVHGTKSSAITTNQPVESAAASASDTSSAASTTADGAVSVKQDAPTPSAAVKPSSPQASDSTVPLARLRSEAVPETTVPVRSRAGESDLAPAPVGTPAASATGAASDTPVAVPAAVMKANLISSRVPTYPENARGDHIEGRVVMQAIITRNGRVGHLHVVSGDSVLRGAAIEAVVAWRYQPYLVNGQPVEVSTTISVDFLVDQ